MSKMVADAPSPTFVCHSFPPAERLPELLRTFDALLLGQSFELQSAHPQIAARERLTRERRGMFEWSPIEEGPALWRTTVTRRIASGTLREVTEALEWDHDRLDDLERLALEARAAGDEPLAARRFNDFAHGLRRHIAFEEAILFPAFEARTSFPPNSGPTAVMRQEHREIERLLAELESRFGNANDSLEDPRAALHELLETHNVKEESVLYPFTDRLLTPVERDELVARIQAFVG